MENTEIKETIESVPQPVCCPEHNERLRVCSLCNKQICTKCILFNKEEIAHYKEHFDSITYLVNDDIKLFEYEGFDVINKVMLEYVTKINDLVETSIENILVSKEVINDKVKKVLLDLYLETTTKFENTVKAVNSNIEKLDINDQTSKENFKIIKKSLDDQSEYLDNYEAISANFNKIFTGAIKKFERLKVSELITTNYDFKVGKKGECLDLIGCNGSIVETTSGRGGTYWCVRSEEVLTGEFKAKIKIHHLDVNKVSSYWSYGVGICRKNSTNIDNYFNDAVVLQANGYLANKFTGTGSFKKIMKNTWKPGDEIIISRDKNNNVFFAVNDEKETILAFDNISGEFRIVIGFAASNCGDKFELVEIN